MCSPAHSCGEKYGISLVFVCPATGTLVNTMIALLIFYPHSFVELSPGTESFLKQMELFRANFQNATHLIGVALSAFHCIPNPLQCLGQGCARAGNVDPLETASAVSEDFATVKPQLRLVDHQVFQFING